MPNKETIVPLQKRFFNYLHDGEVMKALERAKVAFDTYLSLAPKSQLEQARAG